MESRNQLVGVVLAVALFLLLYFVLNKVNPAQPPARPATTQSSLPQDFPLPQGNGADTAVPPTTNPGQTTAPASQPVASAPALMLVAGKNAEIVTVDAGALAVQFNPRGGSVETIDLVSKDAKGRLKYKLALRSKSPYRVIAPVSTTEGEFHAFATQSLRLGDRSDQPWRLGDLIWETTRPSDREVEFSTTLQDAQGAAVIRLKKRFTVSADRPIITLTLSAENAGASPRTIFFEQNGPIGVQREDPNHDLRRLIAAAKLDDGRVELGGVKARAVLAKKAETNESVHLVEPSKRFLWAAAIDKYFGIFVRPIDPAAPDTRFPDFINVADGTVAERREPESKLPDLLVKLWTKPATLAPSSSQVYTFEIYAGPKDPHILAEVNPAYVDATKLGYKAVTSLDQSCCTFSFLLDWMSGLLHAIQYVVRNYGFAIIILVLIVRTLLHPLAVMQQKRMYRFQEVMSRFQPKLAELNTRFAKDPARKQQEMLKLYAEEGVNPLAPFLAMVPMFIQIPLLGALWGALNSDVQLRHAPFDGWWIQDLSAPDALIRFATPFTVPVLSMLPLVGRMFVDIPAINALPILMGISMYLQQKYMPKPAMAKRMEEAKKKAAAGQPPAGGMTFEEQMRQQQMMANMMTIMFPLMFYYTPSGLSLYWMATNIFGICESLLIRRQIDEEHRRGEQGGVVKKVPKPPGPIGRAFKRMAEQMAEIQKQADTLSDRKKGR